MTSLITRNLGTITPTLAWQNYGLASVGGESYRFTFRGNQNRLQGWFDIRAVYRDGSVSPIRRVYATPQSKIVEFPLPDFLKEAANRDRIWQIKRGQRWPRNFLGASPVSVELEEISGSSFPRPVSTGLNADFDLDENFDLDDA